MWVEMKIELKKNLCEGSLQITWALAFLPLKRNAPNRMHASQYFFFKTCIACFFKKKRITVKPP
jgi:hypothetical protein